MGAVECNLTALLGSGMSASALHEAGTMSQSSFSHDWKHIMHLHRLLHGVLVQLVLFP